MSRRRRRRRRSTAIVVASPVGAKGVASVGAAPPLQLELASPSPEVLAELGELAGHAEEYAEQARAESTVRAYAGQWRRFEAWCRGRGALALPTSAAALTLYVTQLARSGAKLPTLEQLISAVADRHERAGFTSPHHDPRFTRTWDGIRRVVGAARRRVTALGPEALRMMIRALPDSLSGKRDRAVILLGFGGALRRQELVDVEVEHAHFDDDGLSLFLPKSKTDQERRGVTVAIPYGSDPLSCPVRALRAWLAASLIERGYVFRGVRKGSRLSDKQLDGRDVARILKRAAHAAGFNEKEISGHSLRRGLGTTAAKQGKRLDVIRKHMRHKRLDQTVEYVEDARAFEPDENAASGIGL